MMQIRIKQNYLNLYDERYDFGHFIFMWDKQKNQWNFMGKNSLGSVVKGPLGNIKGAERFI